MKTLVTITGSMVSSYYHTDLAQKKKTLLNMRIYVK